MTEQQIVPYRGGYTVRGRDSKKSKWYYLSKRTSYGYWDTPCKFRSYKGAKRFIKRLYGTNAKIVDLYGPKDTYDYIFG